MDFGQGSVFCTVAILAAARDSRAHLVLGHARPQPTALQGHIWPPNYTQVQYMDTCALQAIQKFRYNVPLRRYRPHVESKLEVIALGQRIFATLFLVALFCCAADVVSVDARRPGQDRMREQRRRAPVLVHEHFAFGSRDAADTVERARVSIRMFIPNPLRDGRPTLPDKSSIRLLTIGECGVRLAFAAQALGEGCLSGPT